MKVKSIFLDKVPDLPPEPMPKKVVRDIRRDGKRVTVAVPRRAK